VARQPPRQNAPAAVARRLSLLLRGAQATRWAYHSRSRVVVASQTTMALILVIGTALLYTMMPSRILVEEFVTPGHLVVSGFDPSILAISLTTAGIIGLALLVRRSWRTALG
jgi:hypothetical protein